MKNIIQLLSAAFILLGIGAICLATYDTFNVNLVKKINFDQVSTTQTIPSVTVDNSHLIKIKGSFAVETEHISEEDKGSDGIKKNALLSVPLNLVVKDPQGNVIHNAQNELNGESILSLEATEFYGGKAKVLRSITLASFESSSEQLSIELSVGEDKKYSSKVLFGSLSVYDGVKATGKLFGLGLILVIPAFLILVYSIIYKSDYKNFTAALLLSVLFGGMGLDRFYLGYFWLGLLKLITFGGCGIWYLVDLILIATKQLKNSVGSKLE